MVRTVQLRKRVRVSSWIKASVFWSTAEVASSITKMGVLRTVAYGDTDQLLFPRTQVPSHLRHRTRKTQMSQSHRVQRLQQHCRRQHMKRVNIVLQRPCKQQRVLGYKRHRMPQFPQSHSPNIHSVDLNSASSDLYDPKQGLGE